VACGLSPLVFWLHMQMVLGARGIGVVICWGYVPFYFNFPVGVDFVIFNHLYAAICGDLVYCFVSLVIFCVV
ncbi:hypothetical protein ACQWHJ_25875, partial [Salmonella enterica subsp. enterica serovar Infantis]